MDRARYPSRKSVAAAATKMALHASGACGDPLNHTAPRCSKLQGGLHRALQQRNRGLQGGRTCKEHRDGSHASEREQRRQREHLRCMHAARAQPVRFRHGPTPRWAAERG